MTRRTGSLFLDDGLQTDQRVQDVALATSISSIGSPIEALMGGEPAIESTTQPNYWCQCGYDDVLLNAPLLAMAVRMMDARDQYLLACLLF